MYTKKYYFKGSDLLKFRSLFLSLILTFIFSLVGILSVFISSAYALNWSDKEWVQSGCPETALGKWIPDNPDISKFNSLTIKDTRIAQFSQGSLVKQYRVVKNSLQSGIKFIEMELLPTNNETGIENYIKIRPHLVQVALKNHTNCHIKVFNFKSQDHAKYDKYSGWDIYQLKND
jgi:hypothetical protein